MPSVMERRSFVESLSDDEVGAKARCERVSIALLAMQTRLPSSNSDTARALNLI